MKKRDLPFEFTSFFIYMKTFIPLENCVLKTFGTVRAFLLLSIHLFYIYSHFCVEIFFIKFIKADLKFILFTFFSCFISVFLFFFSCSLCCLLMNFESVVAATILLLFTYIYFHIFKLQFCSTKPAHYFFITTSHPRSL